MKHIFVPACLVGRKTWFSRKTWFLNVKVVIKKYQSLLSAKKILVKGWVWHFLDKVRKVVFSLIFFLTFSPQTYRIDFVLVLHRIISSSPHPSKTDHPVQALPRIAVRGWINNIDKQIGWIHNLDNNYRKICNRVAEVVRGHMGPPPKSLDSDSENCKYVLDGNFHGHFWPRWKVVIYL